MDFFSLFAVLDPAGVIGLSERGLMLQATFFMLIVAVPVYILLVFFARYYKAGNTKAKYTPNWEHAKIDELVWWAIPFEIVLILGALTWSSTHALDPNKPLEATGEPLVIQVVALDWKWLFIYPEEHIATVGYVEIPVHRPVQFDVTADAPMNSFWIPRLGGQIYAMTGMVNELHLMASEEGEFSGLSANYSGEGFAHMKFVVKATSPENFDSWVMQTKTSPKTLTYDAYRELALPSILYEPLYYAEVEENLYDTIVMQFMFMGGGSGHTQ